MSHCFVNLNLILIHYDSDRHKL